MKVTSNEVKQVLALVTATKETEWCIRAIYRGRKGIFGGLPTDCDDKYCFVGHVLYNPSFATTAELHSIARRVLAYTTTYLGVMSFDINNGDCEKYQQRTPRRRVIAALTDMYKMVYLEEIGPVVEEAINEVLNEQRQAIEA